MALSDGVFNFCFSFTEEEYSLVERFDCLRLDQNKVFKPAVISAMKKELALAEFDVSNMPNELLFDPDGRVGSKSLKTVAGIGLERVKRTVEALMFLNSLSTSSDCRFCVTRGLVFKLCGCNRATINAYFKEHEDVVNAHNKKYNLTLDSNRKGARWDWLKELANLEHRYGNKGLFSIMYNLNAV